MANGQLDPETYAAIVARISAGADRQVVLSEHGFDEETFEAAEDALDEALSAEMERASDDAGPPASVIALDRALRAATESTSTSPPSSTLPASTASAGPLSIERYAEAVAILETGDRIEHRLAQAGLTLAQVFQATAHYAPRLAREPALAATFQRHKKRDGNEGMDR